MNNKEFKQHQKMIKKHQRILSDMAKKALPYDYGFGLDLFVQFLKFMQVYYEDGINVCAPEVEGAKPRLESITEALDEYELYSNAWEDYTADAQYNEIIYSDEGITITGSSITDNYTEEDTERALAKEQLHWNNFWNIVRDNMLTWWD